MQNSEEVVGVTLAKGVQQTTEVFVAHTFS